MGAGGAERPEPSLVERALRIADLHRERLIRKACRHGPEAWAEDAVQEALVRVQQAEVVFNGPRATDKALLRWLLHIVRNEARNRRRLEAIRKYEPLDTVAHNPGDAPESDVDLCLEAYQRLRFGRDVDEAFRGLPDGEREVASTHLREGTLVAIATARGTSTETVRTQWRRARAKLRVALGDWRVP